MRTCSICGRQCALAGYFRNKRSADGYQKHCKACHKRMADAWVQRNIEKFREKSRRSVAAWRKRHPEESRKRAREHFAKHRVKYLKNNRERYARKRLEVIARYGGRCKCCGETESAFLTLDHVNNDGSQHRKVVRPGSLVTWIIRKGFPKTIQILCFNCNCAKGFYGVCPHTLSTSVQD